MQRNLNVAFACFLCKGALGAIEDGNTLNGNTLLEPEPVFFFDEISNLNDPETVFAATSEVSNLSEPMETKTGTDEGVVDSSVQDLPLSEEDLWHDMLHETEDEQHMLEDQLWQEMVKARLEEANSEASNLADPEVVNNETSTTSSEPSNPLTDSLTDFFKNEVEKGLTEAEGSTSSTTATDPATEDTTISETSNPMLDSLTDFFKDEVEKGLAEAETEGSTTSTTPTDPATEGATEDTTSSETSNPMLDSLADFFKDEVEKGLAEAEGSTTSNSESGEGTVTESATDDATTEGGETTEPIDETDNTTNEPTEEEETPETSEDPEEAKDDEKSEEIGSLIDTSQVQKQGNVILIVVIAASVCAIISFVVMLIWRCLKNKRDFKRLQDEPPKAPKNQNDESSRAPLTSAAKGDNEVEKESRLPSELQDDESVGGKDLESQTSLANENEFVRRTNLGETGVSFASNRRGTDVRPDTAIVDGTRAGAVLEHEFDAVEEEHHPDDVDNEERCVTAADREVATTTLEPNTQQSSFLPQINNRQENANFDQEIPLGDAHKVSQTILGQTASNEDVTKRELFTMKGEEKKESESSEEEILETEQADVSEGFEREGSVIRNEIE